MYFDFDGRYDHTEPIGGGLRRWDGILLSVAVHVVAILIVLFAPVPEFLQRAVVAEEPAPQPQPEEEAPRFVFVQPRLDTPSPKPPPRAEASDLDRMARSTEPAPAPANPMPSARGNSTNRVESTPEEIARGRGPDPEPREPTPAETLEKPVETPQSQQPRMTMPQARPPTPSGGSLGEALKNLQKYVEQESFHNPQGQAGDQLGPLQFDTKGVEFGPWIRRFVSQVRRNWFVPYAAMTMRGRVVLTFNVHKNGALTDVTVVQPSPIESFNTAAMNALLQSNPTQPLPPEYPADKAFFTVTFYYNDSPGR